MNKIRLDLDHLVVDSFHPSPREFAARGTVRANSGDCGETSWHMDTCGWTCMNECLESGTAPCTECV